MPILPQTGKREHNSTSFGSVSSGLAAANRQKFADSAECGTNGIYRHNITEIQPHVDVNFCRSGKGGDLPLVKVTYKL